jgi:hypothetical protein
LNTPPIRRSRVGLTLALLATALGLVWWWLLPPETAPTQVSSLDARPLPLFSDENPAPSSEAASPPASTFSGSKEAERDVFQGALEPDRARLERILEDFKQHAKYPPTSRPLDERTRYKLTWNEPLVDDLPLENPGEHTGDTYYRLTTNVVHVTPGQPLESSLEVWRGTPQQRLPVILEGAWVEALEEGQFRRRVALDYVARPGPQYVNRFIPSEAPALQSLREVRLAVAFSSGGKRALATRAFTYAPKELLRWMSARDGVVDGSLRVELELEAETAGLYRFEANLVSGDGSRPLAYCHENHRLLRGRNLVPLTFFGKILHDAKVDGPYRVQDIRAALRSHEPPWWWIATTVHRTQPYRSQVFSDREWDAPEKQQRIDLLERTLEESESQLDPPPPTHIHFAPDASSLQGR